ncbi:TetR/AcrR family transcriptional regulator [Bradyrhizobium tropiciagri]|uniref:TetR/AcrR family transcriptional regulator n=1 Tax=Bradyrhizobium tropiciagri TaxID=312253 RepID=UPI001BA9E6DB|nr:TetR/AcrR family transcriptional regulator [Bradyrhizobium tropiciagri]MBR0899042.1 TetR/AcrR family transcriptional regulator [Bradyrhizobium tropiciagri]
MSKSKRTPAKSAKASSAAPRRRTQAERREATRKLILDASVEVMVRMGPAGLRMEDVEREAGVSRGALLHHFRTKQDLVLATFEHVNDRSLERSQQRIKFAERARSVPAIIDAILADATEFFFGQGFFIEFALAFGQAYPELRGTVRRLSRRSRFAVEETWQHALERHGLPQAVAADVLSLTLNHVRGFMVRRFIDDNAAQRAHLSVVWQDMVRGYLTEKLGAEAFLKAMAPTSESVEASAREGATRINHTKKSKTRN